MVSGQQVKPLSGWADDEPDLYPGEILRGVIGSTIHGLSVKGTDDLDLMGVCVEAPHQALSMGNPFEQYTFRTQPQNVPSGPGDIDLTVYSLRKFLRLASKGNPTILNLLFVPPQYRHWDDYIGRDLLKQTPFILSRQCAWRYKGYLRSQRERLEGKRGQKHTGYTRRLKYQSEAGWDTKYAMHIIRLGVQGVELLKTGTLTLPISNPIRSEIMRVREGQVEFEDVIAWAEDLENQLEYWGHHSSLPERPDNNRLNNWLVNTYRRVWEENAHY